MLKQSAFQIEVSLNQDWRDIELLRTSVLNCLATVFHENEFCSTIGMITGELLENALKFGARVGEASFSLNVYGNKESVTIEVSNPIDGQSAELARLKELIGRIQSAPDRRAVFLERLAEVAMHPPDINSQSSGLGLARIAYEGNCELTATVVDESVCIRAVTRPC